MELEQALAAEYLRLKARARLAVLDAIQTSKILRPRVCADCFTYCKPEGHHHKGYARENWLDVRWLCPKCHRNQPEPE